LWLEAWPEVTPHNQPLGQSSLQIMAQTSSGKNCYFCGAPASSREHVPPKCLFPAQKYLQPGENFRDPLVTVPSCPTHNEAKSADDEHLLHMLILNIANNSTAQNYFTMGVIKSLQTNKTLLKKLSDSAEPVVAVNTDTGVVDHTFAVDIDHSKIVSSLLHLAYGLHYAHTGNRWMGGVQVDPEFMLNSLDPVTALSANSRVAQITALADTLFANEPFHGNHQQVFKYQVLTGHQIAPVVMRLHFYEGARVFLAFRRDIRHGAVATACNDG